MTNRPTHIACLPTGTASLGKNLIRPEFQDPEFPGGYYSTGPLDAPRLIPGGSVVFTPWEGYQPAPYQQQQRFIER